ncbi:MAG: hypothetical protein FWE15_30625 [Actinomycetia bacterium]|nr:hypothetical protein [Actinomycetes bacterium]
MALLAGARVCALGREPELPGKARPVAPRQIAAGPVAPAPGAVSWMALATLRDDPRRDVRGRWPPGT